MSGRPAEVSAALTTRKKVDGVTTSLHRWQVTNVPIHHTEQSGDGGLVRGNRIEIAHFTAPVGLCGRSCPQSVVALPGLAKAAVIAAMSTKSREVIFGSRIRGAKMARGKRPRKRSALPTAPKRKHGRSRWKAMVGPRNRRRRSGNALMAATAGSRSNAIAAGPARACRSMRSGVRAIRRSGNWRRR
jgi:hypothetical protein